MGETQFPNIGDFFDAWALNGRDLSMEKGHSKAVNKFLRSIDFTDSFSFLDVGCGNGWVVRLGPHIRTAKLFDVISYHHQTHIGQQVLASREIYMHVWIK